MKIYTSFYGCRLSARRLRLLSAVGILAVSHQQSVKRFPKVEDRKPKAIPSDSRLLFVFGSNVLLGLSAVRSRGQFAPAEQPSAVSLGRLLLTDDCHNAAKL